MFECYRIDNDVQFNSSSTHDSGISGVSPKKPTDFVTIIKSLDQLQQHAKRVNKIKLFQSEILDISKSNNKSITFVDAKMQRIVGSPNRVISINKNDISNF